MLSEGIGVLRGIKLIREGRKATETDVEDYTEGPDVDSSGVASVLRIFKDFGGDV